MLTCDSFVRFTAEEIEEAKTLGLDLSWVRTRADLVQTETDWINTLAEERFELLENLAQKIAEAKGVKLPPKLAVV